ncbi:thymidylate synthase [Curtobacterium luteum]|uniref:thymidylate synthase n=1 Tax=Curtobacterium luteum TaxID=33881 RepID=UPI00381F45E5
MEFRNVSEAFVGALQDVMHSGRDITVRGNRTRELTHQLLTLTHPMERSVAVPFRHNDPFAAIAETMWVLAGRNDIAFLSHYLPRASDYSDDGATWRAGYGARLRAWDTVDQLAAVTELLRTDPDSRRAVMSLYDPATDFAPSNDVPCTNWLQFLLRDGELHMSVTIRSNDLFWGFSGINTFEWSVLLEMVAFWVHATPGTAHYFIGSLHVYERHFTRADAILDAAPAGGPTVTADAARARFTTPFHELAGAFTDWFALEDRIRGGDNCIVAIDAFPDPLLREFLLTLQLHWARHHRAAETAATARALLTDPDLLAGLRAYDAWQDGTETAGAHRQLTFADLRDAISRLHRAKDAIYGVSWKQRGERDGILANIARKVDRLQKADLHATNDTESVVDTAVDLYVYAVKYRTYLLDQAGTAAPAGDTWSDGPDGLDELLRAEPTTGIDLNLSDAIEAALYDAYAAVERAIDTDADQAAKTAAAEQLAATARALLLLVAALQPRETAMFLRQQAP